MRCMELLFNYDPIVNRYNDRLHQVTFWVDNYLIILLLLIFAYKYIKNSFLIYFFLLGWGKLIDQFYKPYEYPTQEIIWDVAVTLIFIITYLSLLLSRKKKNE